MRSASTIGTPYSLRNTDDTVDLPHAIPPVRPIRYMIYEICLNCMKVAFNFIFGCFAHLILDRDQLRAMDAQQLPLIKFMLFFFFL
jgi:hypothetical protein